MTRLRALVALAEEAPTIIDSAYRYLTDPEYHAHCHLVGVLMVNYFPLGLAEITA